METLLDYIAASTNALNGGLLAQRPDHYRKNYWTVVGIMVPAMFGVIGRGQKFRETFFQVFTAFSLPWYAVVGVEKGLPLMPPFDEVTS